jgi:hypothetical protein
MKGTLVKGKEYVFFLTAWDNKEEREIFDRYDLDEYNLDKKSDALLWAGEFSLLPVSKGIIETPWGSDKVSPTYSLNYENRFKFIAFERSLGFLSTSDYKETVGLYKGITKPEDFQFGGYSLYTEEDFIKALKILQARYPKGFVPDYSM